MTKKKAGIYTRTGDQGQTDLLGGSRVDKDSARVEAYGTVDELNAILGIIKTTGPHQRIMTLLCQWEKQFRDINAEIANNKEQSLLPNHIQKNDVIALENLIDEFDRQLPPLDHFITPSLKPSAAFLNHARTVCRRAERRLWALSRQELVNPHLLHFFNRLSDLLFTLMRWENENS